MANITYKRKSKETRILTEKMGPKSIFKECKNEEEVKSVSEKQKKASGSLLARAGVCRGVVAWDRASERPSVRAAPLPPCTVCWCWQARSCAVCLPPPPRLLAPAVVM